MPINESTVDSALNSKFNDFEDGLQYYTAQENNIPAIITRNTEDYKKEDGEIIIQTSREYIEMNIKLFEETGV